MVIFSRGAEPQGLIQGSDLARKLGPEDRLAGAIQKAIDQNMHVLFPENGNYESLQEKGIEESKSIYCWVQANENYPEGKEVEFDYKINNEDLLYSSDKTAN